jgi:hypothetical protein
LGPFLIWNRVKVSSRAYSALSAFAEEERFRVYQAVWQLYRQTPDEWPKDKVKRLPGEPPVYEYHLSPELVAFVQTLSGQAEVIELVDIVRADTLQQMLEMRGEASAGE